ncbi:DedA family protein [Cellulomonas telluris]|uniref:DedA family protein n=1 Tax=Cellulomonas telluris TaxID=2306636 RepID=UPI0010A7B876|nr:VTT domain-containing protein [Cellulomonas telluris]
MPIDAPALLDAVAPHGALVVLVMTAMATVEALLGIGVVVPGEAVVASGAALLASGPLVAVAWCAVTAGAFLGDQLGYGLGRRYGAAVTESWVVRRLGRHRWERASDLVRRRSLVVVVVARLLPGVRTLVSAAAGAAGVRWTRYAVADAVACALWAGIWVLGGAALGRLVLGPVGWAAIAVAVAVLIALQVLRSSVRRRARTDCVR